MQAKADAGLDSSTPLVACGMSLRCAGVASPCSLSLSLSRARARSLSLSAPLGHTRMHAHTHTYTRIRTHARHPLTMCVRGRIPMCVRGRIPMCVRGRIPMCVRGRILIGFVCLQWSRPDRGPSIKNYKSKWRNIWIRDVFSSQHLWCQGSQPKHVSNPDSVIKKFKPHFIYDCLLVQAKEAIMRNLKSRFPECADAYHVCGPSLPCP